MSDQEQGLVPSAAEKSDAASNATSVASVDDDVSPSTYQKNDCAMSKERL